MKKNKKILIGFNFFIICMISKVYCSDNKKMYDISKMAGGYYPTKKEIFIENLKQLPRYIPLVLFIILLFLLIKKEFKKTVSLVILGIIVILFLIFFLLSMVGIQIL